MPTYVVETKASKEDPHDIQIAVTVAGDGGGKMRHLVGGVTYDPSTQEYFCDMDDIREGIHTVFTPEKDARVALDKVVTHVLDRAVELEIEGISALNIHRRV